MREYNPKEIETKWQSKWEKDNIFKSQGVRTINPVSNFLNGTIMRARTVKVPRSTYMGTKAKGMNQP